MTAYQLSISETLTHADVCSSVNFTQHTIFENLSAIDSYKFGFHLPISESLSIQETLQSILAILASENLFLNGSLSSSWEGTETANSTIHALDMASLIKGFSDLVEEDLSIEDFSKFAFQLLIIDSILCSSVIEAKALFYRQMEEGFRLSDEALKAWESLISDTFDIVESAAMAVGHMATIAEALSAADDVSPVVFKNEVLGETLLLAPALSLRSILGALVQETLGISGTVVIDGDVWECWVLNTSKFHPSIYSGFDFNSYAIFESRAYGCKNDGIYELSGETDNGETVHTGLTIPETAFGLTNKKRFRRALLGIVGDTPMIKVENENDYAFYPLNVNETTINRSLSGKKWKFSVLDFEKLHFIELFPVILTR
ncbi:MAG: hypothetical protein KKF30_10435 [Proteobacteria bacterium]|nr:hypothetical protein [Pseudomonadota bacterium]MBU4470310.1 hypothetical protein [Pseudomonadota bacterium]MCG2752722.1 hypothetical protein [Desulfobacteraceae bacterium]